MEMIAAIGIMLGTIVYFCIIGWECIKNIFKEVR